MTDKTFTDFQKDLEYIKAVSYSNLFSTPEYTNSEHYRGEGFHLTNPSALSDKIIISQNNTIIALLVSLHQKINKLENLSKEKQKVQIDIDNITDQFKNINLNKKNKVKKDFQFIQFKDNPTL